MIPKYQAQLVEKRLLTNFVILARLKVATTFPYQAGQFIKVDYPTKPLFYSIANPQNKNGIIELISTYKKESESKAFFDNLNQNDQITFAGPFGHFILRYNLRPKILLATGVGISAIRAMIMNLAHQKFNQSFLLLWGLQYESDICLMDEWQNIKNQNHNFDFQCCLSREKSGNYLSGYVQDNLSNFLQRKSINPVECDYYVCGKIKNVETIIEYLTQNLKVNPDNVFFEKF